MVNIPCHIIHEAGSMPFVCRSNRRKVRRDCRAHLCFSHWIFNNPSSQPVGEAQLLHKSGKAQPSLRRPTLSRANLSLCWATPDRIELPIECAELSGFRPRKRWISSDWFETRMEQLSFKSPALIKGRAKSHSLATWWLPLPSKTGWQKWFASGHCVVCLFAQPIL